MFFEGMSPQWSSKGMLGEHMGDTFSPRLATWNHFLRIFGASNVALNFASKLGAPGAVAGRGFAAGAEPLELKLGELCIAFYQQSNTPCYL